MLRELLRPRPESRSKALIKHQDLDNIHSMSEHSTHPVSCVQNSFITNSKRGIETNNPNLSMKHNSNATNHSNSNNNIITESCCLPSSALRKDKGITGIYQPISNNKTIQDNITSSNNPTINQRQRDKHDINKNKLTNRSKDEPQLEYSTSNHQVPLSASKIRSSHSTNRLQTLESFISQIKHNVYEKSKPIITSKSKAKDKLKNNVDILSSNMRTIHRETKVNSQLNKVIVKENERLISSGERAVRDTYFMNKELPWLRNEIDEMKTLIAQHNEETRYIRNDSIQIERETLLAKDEIKKTNGQIALILKQKEKFGNAIVLIHKHIETMKEKIRKQDRLSDELMNSVKTLVDQSSHVFNHMNLE